MSQTHGTLRTVRWDKYFGILAIFVSKLKESFEKRGDEGNGQPPMNEEPNWSREKHRR